MALTEVEVEAVVREVTDEEVEHYHEYGWVMLRELVDPAFAAEMLRALYEAGAKEDPPALFPAGHPAKGGLEPFRSFMFSQRMSSNAARLVNRRRLKGVDVPLRWRQDIPVLKPKGQAPRWTPRRSSGPATRRKRGSSRTAPSCSRNACRRTRLDWQTRGG